VTNQNNQNKNNQKLELDRRGKSEDNDISKPGINNN